MTDEVLRTLISVVAYLSDLFVFLIAVLCAGFTLQQPRIREALNQTTALVRVVALVALSGLLASVGSRITGDFMTLPRSLTSTATSGFYASVEFLGGLVSIAGLAAAAWFLLRQSKSGPQT